MIHDQGEHDVWERLVYCHYGAGEAQGLWHRVQLLFHGLDRIPQERKTIRRLNGLWSATANSFGLETLPIATDLRHSRMSRQPGGERFGGAVRQQIHNLPTLPLHEDGAEALAFAPASVIHPEDRRWRGRRVLWGRLLQVPE